MHIGVQLSRQLEMAEIHRADDAGTTRGRYDQRSGSLEEPSPMDQVLERIAAWEAAGLIDSATAERLRLAETERPSEGAEIRSGPSSIASVFGPGVTIGEMFAYLGGAFLLGAYETFLTRMGEVAGRTDLAIAIGSAAAAIALTVLGVTLRKGDARRRRAAGVMFALAVVHVAGAAAAVAVARAFDWPGAGIIATGAATLAAIGFRVLHPSLLTQFALLASATSFAGLLLDGLHRTVTGGGCCEIPPNPPLLDPVLAAVFSAAWWLAFAVMIGLVGLREARTADVDPAAGRRASLTRLWAGLVAVIGLAAAVTRSGETATGEFGRVIEPWVGELALLVLAAILVERAFRRDASTYVYAAALALIIALSDFNFAYLSSTTEVGLLIEGVILLAVGVGADRLRRRLGRQPPSAAPDAPPAQA